MTTRAQPIESKTYIDRLWDHQKNLYFRAREAFKIHRTVCVQLHTGGGKTAIASSMVASVFSKNKIAWFITPRRDLVDQASRHFIKWGVPHGKITASSNESRAYNIHVISKDTLIRRWDKIKRWADFIIVDECHINYDFQLDLLKRAPISTKFLGFTATPQRLDDRGLSEIYEILIEGESIPWLTANNYLTEIKYYAPPLAGMEDLKWRGVDVDAITWEEFAARKKIYGGAIEHYEDKGRGKAALMFCRTVKSAYALAEEFRARGHNFHCIEGNMPDKKRRDLIRAHTNGEIQGLTNCLIATYGLDIPRIEYIGDLSPTLSFALIMQKIGRGIRPFIDPKTGYEKKYLVYMDHVNAILEHGIEVIVNGKKEIVPPHYVEKIEWNFYGTEKRKRNKEIKNVMLCPKLDFMYCANPHCSTCEHNTDKSVRDARKPMIIVPAELVEIKKPVAYAERPPEERRELQDRIGAAVLEFKAGDGIILPGPVGELLKIAESLGYAVLWVYYRLTDENRKTVNVPLLAEIARQKKYHPWWVKHAVKKVRAREESA